MIWGKKIRNKEREKPRTNLGMLVWHCRTRGWGEKKG